MNITYLTIMQDGQVITATKSKEAAVSTAQARAKMTGSRVSVVAHLDDGRDREVIFNPDGTNERIWDIDKGQRMQPVVDHVYTNRGGGKFRCLAQAAGGPMFYSADGSYSSAAAVLKNIASGWTFTAKGIIQYIDGTIEWDHSIDGHFEEVTA